MTASPVPHPPGGPGRPPGRSARDLARGLGRGFRRWFPSLYAGWAFVLPLVAFGAYMVFTGQISYRLEVTVTADRPARMQAFFDEGAGTSEAHSAFCEIEAHKDASVASFPIDVGTIRGIRLDPSEAPVVMRIHSMAIRSEAREWLTRVPFYTFNLHDLQPVQQIDALTEDEQGVRIVVGGKSDDPITGIILPAPVSLDPVWSALAVQALLTVLAWLVCWAGLVELCRWLSAAVSVPPWLRGALTRRVSPATAVWLVAAASTVLSCYPVVFLGKSFVSPNFMDASFRLYNRFPTLPGTQDTVLESGHGVDLDAMAMQNAPYSDIESRALWHDHELPLWNRYNYCGLPLLGQGQSMLGDPLLGIVLAAHGAAWAWDVKFVLAKLALAAGAGFLVLAATDCLPAALLVAFSSVFLGFFGYRIRHPAYFSLCYAPWILFAWVQIVRAPTWRSSMRWAGGLILANWLELTSGTAKESYMLLLCLNGCGVLALGLSQRPVRARLLRLAGALGAGVLFCLLAAPILLAFLRTFKQSMSVYDVPSVWQLQPGLFIGLFDDIFYRQFTSWENFVDPSANFLVLLGCLLALGSCKRLAGDAVFLAVAISTFLVSALVFGAIPPGVVRLVPLLGNIVHIDNTFSCVLFILLFTLAGFGFKHCLVRVGEPGWLLDVTVAFVIGGALLGAYLGLAQAAFNATASFLHIGQEVPRSKFFYCYVPTIILSVGLLPFVLRRLSLRGPEWPTVVLLATCLFLIHWRMGIQVHTPMSQYTPVLPDRQDLHARSPVIDYLHDDHIGVFRTVGIDATFGIGYGDMVGLEAINGPDALFNPYLYDLYRTVIPPEAWISDPVKKALLPVEKPLFDLLNVRYCLAPPGDILEGVHGLHRVSELDLDVYRNDDVWPRAFFVDRLGFYAGSADFHAQLVAGDGRPFAAIEIGDEPLHHDLTGGIPGEQASRTVVAATNYRLTNHRTSFDLTAPGPGLVVLTEAYMEGEFEVTVNQRPVQTFRVNHAFKGIVLDKAGVYRITFNYFPLHFRAALCLSGVGLVLLLAAAFWLRGRADEPTAAPVLAPAPASRPPPSARPGRR